MQNTHAQKHTVYIIIRCKKNFVHLIFVGGPTRENFLTTKISQSTVKPIKVTGDSVHKIDFVNTKPSVSKQRKQL